jgi:hypothetical protein
MLVLLKSLEIAKEKDLNHYRRPGNYGSRSVVTASGPAVKLAHSRRHLSKLRHNMGTEIALGWWSGSLRCTDAGLVPLSVLLLSVLLAALQPFPALIGLSGGESSH